MNKILTTAVFTLFIVASVFSQQKAILFPLETKYDWGNVYMGEKVEHTFQFINKGNIPLIVFEAKSSCGCTVPEAPKKPILPGEVGAVKVVFDSSGRIDKQNKSVTVKTNTTPEFTTFYLTGLVYNKPTTVQLSIEDQLKLKKKQREDERIAKEKAELAKIEAERLESERLYLEQQANKKRVQQAELQKRKAIDAKNKAMIEAEKIKNKVATPYVKTPQKNHNTSQKSEIEINETKVIINENTPKTEEVKAPNKPTTVIVNKNDKNYISKFKSFFNIGDSKDDN